MIVKECARYSLTIISYNLIMISTQVKSEPCLVEGGRVCPQHYQLCGEDSCIDRYS